MLVRDHIAVMKPEVALDGTKYDIQGKIGEGKN